MELPIDNLEIKPDETEKKKETIQNIIPFWSENPNVLLNNEFMFELFPVEKMSFEQKLNAISRTVILLTLMTFLYKKRAHFDYRWHLSLLYFYALQIQESRER